MIAVPAGGDSNEDNRAKLAERIARRVKVNRATGCHEWQGACRHRFGHPVIGVNGRARGAHRVAWEVARGPIPPGMCVCHHCDNPACVRIDHLFLGTHAENVADKVAKGRQAKGERNGRAKLTTPQVLEILRRADAGEKRRVIASEYGVDTAVVRAIVIGKNWSHVTGRKHESN